MEKLSIIWKKKSDAWNMLYRTLYIDDMHRNPIGNYNIFHCFAFHLPAFIIFLENFSFSNIHSVTQSPTRQQWNWPTYLWMYFLNVEILVWNKKYIFVYTSIRYTDVRFWCTNNHHAKILMFRISFKNISISFI